MSYYLQRGHTLESLKKVSAVDKIFYIESMIKEKIEISKYDSQKIEVLLRAFGGES